MKFKRTNGETFHTETPDDAVKKMFLRQWKNGELQKYMASVKRRVKEVHGIELTFSDANSFFNELVKHNLVEIIKK